MMSVQIKQAKGGAPFWRWYINLGVGECTVGCLFCYNKRWDWSKEPWKTRTLDVTKMKQSFNDFEWMPGKSKQYEGPHDIMMCSVGDPFMEMNSALTHYILNLSKDYPQVGDHLRVLSKLDGHEFVPLASEKTMFGASVCTLDDEIKKVTMPNSAPLMDQLGAYLYVAHTRGNPTFVSCEPMLIGMDLCQLMEELHSYDHIDLTELWVGRLNYGFGCEDYAMPDEEIIEQVRLLLDSYDVKCYVKKEVRGVTELWADGLIQREGTAFEEVQ